MKLQDMTYANLLIERENYQKKLKCCPNKMAYRDTYKHYQIVCQEINRRCK